MTDQKNPPASLPEPFQKQFIVFAGSGGVGKTTLSASVALGLAMRGKKVLVMTIDPARRLMDSLGIKSEEAGSVHQIDLSKLEPGEGETRGELHACMFEPKRSMDEMVRRLAPTEERYEQIMNNRIYQVVADNFSGSQEVIALVRLHEFLEQNYDSIIVDTAPHRYAIEFFETPSRLTDFLDKSILRWFATPVETLQQLGSRFLKKGAEYVFGVVEKSIGLSFVQEITSLVSLFEPLSEGFRVRADKMHEMLKEPEMTSFNIVASPTTFSVADAVYMGEQIERLGMPPGLTIFNRMHQKPDIPAEADTRLQSNASSSLINGIFARALDLSGRITRKEHELRDRYKARFPEVPLLEIPFLSTDITQLSNLNLLNKFVM